MPKNFTYFKFRPTRLAESFRVMPCFFCLFGKSQLGRSQIYPQSGANSLIFPVDTATRVIDRDATVDRGDETLSTAGRPEPPAAVAIVATYIRSIGNCIFCGFTLPCVIGRKILLCFRDAEQENLACFGSVRGLCPLRSCGGVLRGRCQPCAALRSKNVIRIGKLKPYAAVAALEYSRNFLFSLLFVRCFYPFSKRERKYPKILWHRIFYK